MRARSEATLDISVPLSTVRLYPVPGAFAQKTLEKINEAIEQQQDMERFRFFEDIQESLLGQLTHFFAQAIIEDATPSVMDFMTIADEVNVVAVHKIMADWHKIGPVGAHDADLRVRWIITLQKAAHA